MQIKPDVKEHLTVHNYTCMCFFFCTQFVLPGTRGFVQGKSDLKLQKQIHLVENDFKAPFEVKLAKI